MSATVDERVVEMQFNNEQFEKNVHQSISTLDQLKQSLQLGKSAKGLTQFQNGINNLNFEGLSTSFSNAFNKISLKTMMMFSTVDYFVKNGIRRIGQFFKQFTGINEITAGWNRFGEMTSAVQIIMSATRKQVGLLYDNEQEQMAAVTSMMSQLNKFSDETSYSFTEMANSVGKFTSVGVNLHDAQIAIQGVATWAASAGRTTSEASRAMYQLSQAMGSGAMKLMDWKSIENLTMGTVEFKQAAMDAAVAAGTLKVSIKNGEKTYKTATGRMKVTTDNFRETLQKGWFTSDVLTDVLKQYGAFSDTLMGYLNDSYFGDSSYATKVREYLDDWKNAKDQSEYLESITAETGRSAEELEEAFYRLTSFSGTDNSEEVLSNYAERYKMKVEDLSNWTSKYLQDPKSMGREDWKKLSEITGQSVNQLQKDFKKMKKSIKVATMDTYAKKFGMSVTELGKAYKEYKDGTLDFEALSKETGITIKDLQKDFADMAKSDMELGKAAFEKAQEAKTFGEAISATHDAIQTGWANIFKTIFGEYLDAKELWTGVSEALYTAFAGQFVHIGNRLKEIFEPFRKAKGIEKVTEALGNIAEVINTINGVFVDTLLDTILPESGDKLAEMAENFKNATETLKTSVENSELLKTFGSTLKVIFAIIGKVGKIAASILGAIGKAIGSLFNGKGAKNGAKLADTLDGIAESIKAFELPEALKNGFKKFLEVATTLVGALAMSLGKVWEFIKKVGGAIWSVLGPVVKNLGDVLDKAFDGIKNFFSQDDLSFKKIFLSMFKSDEAKAKAEKFFEDIKTAIKSGIEGISTWVTDKSADVKNALLGLFGGGEKGEDGEASSAAVEETVKKVGFLQQVIDAIRGLFGKTEEGSGDNAEAAATEVEKKTKAAVSIHDSIVGFLSNISGGIINADVVDKTIEVVQKIILAALNFIGNIADAIGGINIGSISVTDMNDLAYFRAYIMEIVKTILVIKTAKAVIGAINSVKKVADDISESFKKLAGTPDKLIKAWKSVRIAEVIPDILKQLSILLGLIIGSILLFSYLPKDKINTGLFYVGGIMVGILAFIAAIVAMTKWLTSGKNGNAAKDIIQSYANIGLITGALIGLAILLLGLSAAIAKIGKLKPDEFWRGAITMGAFLVIFGVILGVLYALSNNGKNKKLNNAISSFEGIGKAIRKIAASMMLIALSIAILGLIPILLIAKALAVITILGVVFGLLAAVNNLTTKRNKKGALTNRTNSDIFASMAKALLAAAAAIVLLAIFGPNEIGAAAFVIGELALVLVFMTGLAIALAKFESSMKPSQIQALNSTLKIFALVLLSVAASLILLNKYGPAFGPAMGYVLVFVVLMAAMTAAAIVLSKYASKSKPKTIENAAKSLLIMSGCFIVIAIALSILSKINWAEAGNMPGRIAWMIALVALIGGLIIAMGALKNANASKFKAIGQSMLMASSIFVIIAVVMKLLEKVSIGPDMNAKLAWVVGFTLLLGGLIIAMAALKDAKTDKIKAIGRTMLMMSGVFVVIALVMKTLMFVPASPQMNTQMAWLLGSVALLGGLMIALAAIKEGKAAKLKAISENLVFMSLVFYSIVGVMAILNNIHIDNSFTPKMIMLLVAFTVLGGMLILLSQFTKTGKGLEKAVLALLAVSGALVIIVASMKLIEKIPVGVIWATVGVIAAMALIMGVLGAIAAGPVGAGMNLVAIALVMLASSILLLSIAAIGFGAAALIFVTALEKLGDVWESKGEVIKKAIRDLIDILPELGTAFGQFIGNLLAAVAQGFVDMLKVFADNSEDISQSLYKLAKAGIEAFARAVADSTETVANAILQIIYTICTTIVDNAETIVIMFQGAIIAVVNGIIELSYLFTKAGLGLAIGLVGGFMKAVGEKLSGTALGELFGIGKNWVEEGQKLMDSAKIELPDNFEEAYNKAKAAVDGFKKANDEYYAAGKENASEYSRGAEEGLSEFAEKSNKDGGLLAKLFGGGEGGLNNIAEQVKNSFSLDKLGLDKSAFDLSSLFNIDGLGDKLNGSGGLMETLTSSISGGMEENGEKSGESWLTGFLNSFSGDSKLDASKITSLFGGSEEEVYAKGTADGQQYSRGVEEGLATTIQNESGDAGGLLDKIVGTSEEASASGGSLAESFLGGFKLKVAGSGGEDGGIDLDQILNMVELSGKAKESGALISEEIGSGITESSDINTAVETSVKNITQPITAKKKDMETAGKNLMTGLAKGIKDGESSTLSAVRNLAAKIKAAVLKGLEEHSPSKFTRKAGLYFDQGLAMGIDDGTDQVVGASDKMTRAMTNAFSAAVNSAYDILDTNINDGPTIRPVVDLSDVDAKSKTLNDIFDKSVATSVNLANSVGPRAAASIANRQNAAVNANNTQSNSVTLYIDGIKYNTDDYIDSSITGFIENMIRRGQMYGRA